MQTEFAHLGETFKARREEKRLSLKEVENGTSIRLGYLQAIEDGHLGKLISPIYAHGFISKYAIFLEMDPDELIREHPSVLKILSDKNPQSEDFAYGIGSLETRGSPGGEVKWLPNLMWVGLSAVGILAVWFIARYFGFF